MPLLKHCFLFKINTTIECKFIAQLYHSQLISMQHHPGNVHSFAILQ
ncbi:hypothetical protein Tsp_02113 [Trichinella spiralis]|nr:hypothetical protein Tsp_02113 [Trichinella spiralis]